MPTAIAEIRRERTIGTLVENLFVLTGPTDAEDRRRAERAILRENPQLRDRENFAAGTRVVIPGGLGLRTTDRVRRPDVNLAGLIDDQRARLARAAATIASASERRGAETARALERLADKRFRAAVRAASPEAATRITEMRKRLRQEEAERGTVQEALSDALASAADELARLRELAGEPDQR